MTVIFCHIKLIIVTQSQFWSCSIWSDGLKRNGLYGQVGRKGTIYMVRWVEKELKLESGGSKRVAFSPFQPTWPLKRVKRSQGCKTLNYGPIAMGGKTVKITVCHDNIYNFLLTRSIENLCRGFICSYRSWTKYPNCEMVNFGKAIFPLRYIFIAYLYYFFE